MDDQRTDGWFQERLGHASASRFNDIVARTQGGAYTAGRKNYAVEIALERITGVRVEGWTSREMQWGIDNEPLARLAFEAETGYTVKDAYFVKHPTLDAGASPDGDVEAMPGDDGDGTLEIKCPNSATHVGTLMKRRVPHEYYAQIQGQMLMTGKTWGKFVSFDPRMPINAQLIVIHVPRDDDYIADLEEDIELFLQEVDQYVQFISNYGGDNSEKTIDDGTVKVKRKAA